MREKMLLPRDRKARQRFAKREDAKAPALHAPGRLNRKPQPTGCR
jgi:hypothetical protein